MALPDRILPLCDLLLGAAYADKHFVEREREEVRQLLGDLTGGPIGPELEDRIAKFDPGAFELDKTAAQLASDDLDDRRRVLFLVAAIHDADEEIDFAEDQYLRDLAAALGLPDSALAGLTVDVEVEELRDELEKVRTGPPPPPPKKK
jgi:uncharacterized membrane protein YebE (DUF533 family)